MNKGDFVKVYGYLVKFSDDPDDFECTPYFVDGKLAKVLEVDEEQITVRCIQPDSHPDLVRRSTYGQSFVVHRMQCKLCDMPATIGGEF